MEKTYDEKSINMLRATIEGGEHAQQWLKENNVRELSEFWDAYEGVESSFQWLKNNNYAHFAALVDALNGNDTAKIFLIRSGYKVLALLSDAANGNQSAVSLLLQTGNKKWIAVAKAIYTHNKKKEKKGFWGMLNFGNPFR